MKTLILILTISLIGWAAFTEPKSSQVGLAAREATRKEIPAIYPDSCGAMHRCPNPICWDVEAELAGKIAALTAIEKYPERAREIAHKELGRFWSAPACK